MPRGVYFRTKEYRKKISLAGKGRRMSEETKRKISKVKTGNCYNYGKKMADEQKDKIRKYRLGKKFPLGYKIGIPKKTAEYVRIRMSPEYKQWRLFVFQRDSYKCQICEKIGGELQVHHIKRFSQFPESRFDLNNGVTMCIDCHKKTDTYLKNFKKSQTSI